MAKSQRKANCLRRQPEFSRLDRSRSFFLIGLTLLVLLFMGASIFYINTHVEVVEIGYDINQAMAQKQKLIEQNKRLSLKIARLKSPTRIEEEAKNQLKLISPAPEQFVYLSSIEKSSLFQSWPENERPIPSDNLTPKKPSKKPTVAKKPSQTKNPKIAKAPKQKSLVNKDSKLKVAPLPKIAPTLKLKKNRVLIAKIIRNTATAPAKAKTLVAKKPRRRGKESIPAALIDPMP